MSPRRSRIATNRRTKATVKIENLDCDVEDDDEEEIEKELEFDLPYVSQLKKAAAGLLGDARITSRCSIVKRKGPPPGS